MTETIATRILKYINHIQDTDYLAAIVTATSLHELFEIISQLLESEDYETFDLTCLFIRDSVLICSRHPACQNFVESYSNSLIVQTLENLVSSPNHFVSKQVIYTLGKTCSYSSVCVLTEAFNTWRNTNPIILTRLIGEMAWLGAENVWQIVEDMITSQGYVTRWAVIEALSQFGDDAQRQDEMFQIKRKCFERLRQDANALVKTEAEYEYQLLKFRSESHTLPKAERQKKRKELVRRYKPALCFYSIAMAFENHLYTNGLKQYFVNELEAFIQAKSAI